MTKDLSLIYWKSTEYVRKIPSVRQEKKKKVDSEKSKSTEEEMQMATKYMKKVVS